MNAPRGYHHCFVTFWFPWRLLPFEPARRQVHPTLLQFLRLSTVETTKAFDDLVFCRVVESSCCCCCVYRVLMRRAREASYTFVSIVAGKKAAGAD